MMLYNKSMEDKTHKRMALSDKITLLGDLEHSRHHLVRSAHSAEDENEKFWYLVKAKQTKDLRRKLETKWLNTGELDWCLVKVNSRVKWLNEELLEDDLELFSEIEDLADSILSHALGEDLSGCASCREELEQ